MLLYPLSMVPMKAVCPCSDSSTVVYKYMHRESVFNHATPYRTKHVNGALPDVYY
jgi:hypothetical protein